MEGTFRKKRVVSTGVACSLGKRCLGPGVTLMTQESSYTCPMHRPILNKREKTSGQELGGGVKAVRIFPAEMYICSVFINW